MALRRHEWGRQMERAVSDPGPSGDPGSDLGGRPSPTHQRQLLVFPALASISRDACSSQEGQCGQVGVEGDPGGPAA